MDNKNASRAFPQKIVSYDGIITYHAGMTVRDWFAGQALAGLAARDNLKLEKGQTIEKLAFAIADEMLKAGE